MVKQKKTVGRPKKEFVSKKPKTKIKNWPGRPRKDKKDRIHVSDKKTTNSVTPVVAWFVAKSVDDSKKKDMIILLLFLLSFVLFVVSLYFTFMRDKKTEELTPSELSEITNIDTGNIDYTSSDTVTYTEDTSTGTTVIAPEPTVQNLSTEQQVLVDFYQAINTVDMDTIYKITDARLEESNVFKTYYSRRWLTNFNEAILAPKIVVTNIQEVASTSTNPNIKSFGYTLEYVIASTQQKFTEERSTTLIKKGEDWKVGKLMCETKWCSTMPFFNTEKYK